MFVVMKKRNRWADPLLYGCCSFGMWLMSRFVCFSFVFVMFFILFMVYTTSVYGQYFF